MNTASKLMATIIGTLLLITPAIAIDDLFNDRFNPNTKNHANREYEGENFAGKDLSGFDFTNAELDKANFSGANLTGAKFVRAEVEQVDFTNANLTNADFSEADLEDANLTGANITGAKFKNAELEYTIWVDGKTCAADSVGSCW